MIRLSTCFIAVLLALRSAAMSTPAPSKLVPAPHRRRTKASGTATSTFASTGSGSSTSTESVVPPSESGPVISLNPNNPVWDSSFTGPFDSIRGPLGATIIGPNNPNIAQQNPDLLAPPTTDHGSVPNIKWPMSLSHNRLSTGGWAREQNKMAGVNMRLKPGAIRELHWHKTAEWAYVLKGTTQVTSVDQDGRNFISTVGPGDLWYFPPGIPHSLQATGDDPDGSEFLLVFPNGMFSEDSTFLLTDWLAHIPAEVLAKNFGLPAEAFKNAPENELYIFPAEVPADNQPAPTSPFGTVPDPFAFAFSNVSATQFSGGTAKIVDSSTFKISVTIAAAEVTVEPGAMRELHWHPTEDEWTFFLEGEGRITLFASQSNARTFDFQAGDVGYIPASNGHYVENTGNTTLRFLEIFNSGTPSSAPDKFQDVSLSQWLALTPPAVVKAHLGVSDDTIAHFSKTKPVVVGGSRNVTKV
ncbi:oxalate decarboxylase [Coprinellus micaceus]|uniref:Oxalate decarboxylase n=1 Tax=Coprinellus micaceus TaxID=71717 RepID=A0A4Y7TBI7_COPMI|nr:oxalate decarboxylase [Coprinellus micaceus]